METRLEATTFADVSLPSGHSSVATREVPKLNERFTFYSIPTVAVGAHRGGGDTEEEDFDPSLLPFSIFDGVTIEDVRPLIPDDEFDVYRSGMGTHAHEKLKRLHYAIVHRFPRIACALTASSSAR